MLAVGLLAACGESGRIDQTDSSIPVPKQVEVTSVRPIAGGAVLKFKIPDDDNLKGVEAVYTRNGSEVNTRVSRYVDSLVVEGFADSLEHEVKVYSFNSNTAKSDPVSVKFTPLTPAVQTVKVSMIGVFGGIKVHVMNNVDKADMAVILYTDQDTTDLAKPADERKWVEVTTLFTGSTDVFLTRRGLPAQKALYRAVLRDHWGNLSVPTDTVLTPMAETRLNKKLFRYFNPGDDNASASSNNYPIVGLWDDVMGAQGGNSPHFFDSTSSTPRPSWLTIDLGVYARISRIGVTPRYRYLSYAGTNVRSMEFWGWIGEGAPTGKKEEGNPHGFETGWVQLGTFEYQKPSGYQPDGSVGPVTEEDLVYYTDNAEAEFDNTVYPHAFDKIRYLRAVVTETFSSYGLNTAVAKWELGELTPYGQIIVRQKIVGRNFIEALNCIIGY